MLIPPQPPPTIQPVIVSRYHFLMSSIPTSELSPAAVAALEVAVVETVAVMFRHLLQNVGGPSLSLIIWT